MQENDKYDSVAADQETQASSPEQQDATRRELKSLKKEYDDVYDRLLRKQAEFDNYRKRVERERAEFVQFASAELIKELLNSLDSFELALRNAKTDEQTLRGFELIHKQ